MIHSSARLALALALAVAGCAHRSVRTPRPGDDVLAIEPPSARPEPGDSLDAGACHCPTFDTEELPEISARAPCEYPPGAREAGIHGVVLLRALILADGRVGRTNVLRSIPALDAAAEACVRRWRFKPGRCCGHDAATWVAIPVEFKLH